MASTTEQHLCHLTWSVSAGGQTSRHPTHGPRVCQFEGIRVDRNTFCSVPNPLFSVLTLFEESFCYTSQTESILCADFSCFRINGWNTISMYSPNVCAAPGAIICTATVLSRIMAFTGGFLNSEMLRISKHFTRSAFWPPLSWFNIENAGGHSWFLYLKILSRLHNVLLWEESTIFFHQCNLRKKLKSIYLKNIYHVNLENAIYEFV